MARIKRLGDANGAYVVEMGPKQGIEIVTVYPNGGFSWCKTIKSIVKTQRNSQPYDVRQRWEDACYAQLKRFMEVGAFPGITSKKVCKGRQGVVVHSLPPRVEISAFTQAFDHWSKANPSL